VACDYDALAKLARENGAEFNVSFGPDFDPAAFWREREREGTPLLAQLVKVLSLPHAKEETLYLWPSAYRTGETQEDWKALEGLYPAEKLAEWRKGGEWLPGLPGGHRGERRLDVRPQRGLSRFGSGPHLCSPPDSRPSWGSPAPPWTGGTALSGESLMSGATTSTVTLPKSGNAFIHRGALQR
jgi:hypothetical protein